jgi:hypothetical protein
LRVRVWRIALEEDYNDLTGRNRTIELHHYNSMKKEIRVTVSRRFPTLFEVSRKARYDAAKAAGAEWVTVSDICNFRVYVRSTMIIILT